MVCHNNDNNNNKSLMGNCLCRKKKTPRRDHTEQQMEETYNIMQLTQYGELTPEEKQMLRSIQTVKSRRSYENLVFEGGGVKGIAFCGVIKILDEMGILPKIKRFAGSSAGSIIATFAALGFPSHEIMNVVGRMDFSKFVSNGIFPFGEVQSMVNLTQDMGCNTGEAFNEFMEKWIHERTGNKNYTFLDLYHDLGKELVITGTDVNRELTIYFSHHSHPHMPIKDAVRISMSVPIMFQPVKHNGDLFVDGGLFDNYPIHVFDGAFPGDPQAVNNLIPINPKTLGFKLLRDCDLPNMGIAKREEVDGLKSFMIKLVEALYDSNERHYMRPSYWHRSVVIKVPNIPLTQFNVTSSTKKQMISSAESACEKYFKQDV